jgi:hypothetical protein
LIAMLGLTLLVLGVSARSGWSGTDLPATPLRLFDGGTLDLRTLQGHVVVVRFLASW